MNWAMLAAIGQLAAVVIGVPSIIYFAIQLREQTRERRQAAVNALTRQWSDLTKALHEDAEFAAIFLRGVHSFNDLDAISKLRFSAFQNRFFKNFEGMYYSRCDGILTPELWGEIERTMSDFLATTAYANGGRHGSTGTRKNLAASSTQLSPEAMSPRLTQPTIYARWWRRDTHMNNLAELREVICRESYFARESFGADFPLS